MQQRECERYNLDVSRTVLISSLVSRLMLSLVVRRPSMVRPPTLARMLFYRVTTPRTLELAQPLGNLIYQTYVTHHPECSVVSASPTGDLTFCFMYFIYHFAVV